MTMPPLVMKRRLAPPEAPTEVLLTTSAPAFQTEPGPVTMASLFETESRAPTWQKNRQFSKPPLVTTNRFPLLAVPTVNPVALQTDPVPVRRARLLLPENSLPTVAKRLSTDAPLLTTKVLKAPLLPI